ncbi:tetratricopeptide repeat protein [Qipengyuania sp. RANM35]|uniref:tetratricopeptide repeat protein n=1 Tax=Qipengyuania sp. RANM35 TaxID=3068635 RepID=UPI0034DAFDC4
MIAGILSLVLLQVGPNPTLDAFPGTPPELRDRKTVPAPAVTVSLPEESQKQFADCLASAQSDPETALDIANAWRLSAKNDLDLVRSAHCLGIALVRLERFDEARQIFEVASGEAADRFAAYSARLKAMAGNAALSDGKPALAEPLFASAIEGALAIKNAELASDLYVDRATSLGASERMDEAIEALKLARESNPANTRAWLVSALLDRRLERLDDAQKMIEEAAKLDPRNPAIGLEAGIIAALAGRREDARRSFESVLIVAPDSEFANRATAYLEQLKQ